MAQVARAFRIDDPASASILEMQAQPRIVGEKVLPIIRDVPLVRQVEQSLNLFGIYPEMEGRQVFVAANKGVMADPYFEKHTLPYIQPGKEITPRLSDRQLKMFLQREIAANRGTVSPDRPEVDFYSNEQYFPSQYIQEIQPDEYGDSEGWMPIGRRIVQPRYAEWNESGYPVAYRQMLEQGFAPAMHLQHRTDDVAPRYDGGDYADRYSPNMDYVVASSLGRFLEPIPNRNYTFGHEVQDSVMQHPEIYGRNQTPLHYGYAPALPVDLMQLDPEELRRRRYSYEPEFIP